MAILQQKSTVHVFPYMSVEKADARVVSHETRCHQINFRWKVYFPLLLQTVEWCQRITVIKFLSVEKRLRLRLRVFVLSFGNGQHLLQNSKDLHQTRHVSRPAHIWHKAKLWVEHYLSFQKTQGCLDTHLDIMHQVLLLVDFVGLYTILMCQSENAVLSWSNVSPTQINPLCLLILTKKKRKENNWNVKRQT